MRLCIANFNRCDHGNLFDGPSTVIILNDLIPLGDGGGRSGQSAGVCFLNITGIGYIGTTADGHGTSGHSAQNTVGVGTSGVQGVTAVVGDIQGHNGVIDAANRGADLVGSAIVLIGAGQGVAADRAACDDHRLVRTGARMTDQRTGRAAAGYGAAGDRAALDRDIQMHGTVIGLGITGTPADQTARIAAAGDRRVNNRAVDQSDLTNGVRGGDQRGGITVRHSDVRVGNGQILNGQAAAGPDAADQGGSQTGDGAAVTIQRNAVRCHGGITVESDRCPVVAADVTQKFHGNRTGGCNGVLQRRLEGFIHGFADLSHIGGDRRSRHQVLATVDDNRGAVFGGHGVLIAPQVGAGIVGREIIVSSTVGEYQVILSNISVGALAQFNSSLAGVSAVARKCTPGQSNRSLVRGFRVDQNGLAVGVEVAVGEGHITRAIGPDGILGRSIIHIESTAGVGHSGRIQELGTDVGAVGVGDLSGVLQTLVVVVVELDGDALKVDGGAACVNRGGQIHNGIHAALDGDVLTRHLAGHGMIADSQGDGGVITCCTDGIRQGRVSGFIDKSYICALFRQSDSR